jgi:hypothetical protein
MESLDLYKSEILLSKQHVLGDFVYIFLCLVSYTIQIMLLSVQKDHWKRGQGMLSYRLMLGQSRSLLHLENPKRLKVATPWSRARATRTSRTGLYEFIMMCYNRKIFFSFRGLVVSRK